MDVHLPLYTQAPSSAKFALAAPGTTSYIFSAGARATYFTPHEAVVTVRVTVSLATSGKLYVGMDNGSATTAMPLNADNALTANALYTFTFEARRDYTYDFKLGTDGIVNCLFVSEVGGGIT